MPGPGRLARLMLVAIPLAATGCDYPIGPRDRRNAQPAVLNVNVIFSDSAAGFPYYPDPARPTQAVRGPGAFVQAYIDPGFDDDGDRQRIVNDTLRLLDTAFTTLRRGGSGGASGGTFVGTLSTPSEYGGPGYFGFVSLAERDFANRAVVVQQAPGIEGLTTPALPQTALYAVGRPGPDTVTVTRGSDLRLPLTLPPTAASAPTEFAHWSVFVQGDSGTGVTLNGPGRPPAMLRVPAELLPATARGALIVRLLAHRQQGLDYQMPRTSASHNVVARVESRLVWRVRVVAP